MRRRRTCELDSLDAYFDTIGDGLVICDFVRFDGC